ncbi:uncharacterized protein METZ01_LOCUS318978 [marine metagenome]|uniref:Uncharacterized protein n=1 Tax=marine metagenome TaxID=408172 RepID=A0A382NY61_9ZZZZ
MTESDLDALISFLKTITPLPDDD